jgi:hypothetical protein
MKFPPTLAKPTQLGFNCHCISETSILCRFVFCFLFWRWNQLLLWSLSVYYFFWHNRPFASCSVDILAFVFLFICVSLLCMLFVLSGVVGDVSGLCRRRERNDYRYPVSQPIFYYFCLLGVTMLDHGVLLFIILICMLSYFCMRLMFPENVVYRGWWREQNEFWTNLCLLLVKRLNLESTSSMCVCLLINLVTSFNSEHILTNYPHRNTKFHRQFKQKLKFLKILNPNTFWPSKFQQRELSHIQ